ncbi:MAG: hypothetical protein ACRDFB_08810 [Rhabdochlamydiaceae bacterium]
MMDTDLGHEKLINDLEYLVHEAHNFQFHDFKNSKYDLPKVALVDELHNLISNVKNGEYDN